MTGGRSLSPPADRIPRLLIALSVALALVLSVEVLYRVAAIGDLTTLTTATLPWPYVVSYALSLPFIIGIGGAGYYLSTEPFPLERNPRLLAWCLAGIAIWLVINLATMASFGIVALWPAIGWIRGAVAWGGAFGLIVGIVEARAITNAVDAEQARLRARHLGERRDAVDYVNSLLRHEVLNSITVIRGRSKILVDELPETDGRYDHADAIARQSDAIASVVADARRMIESVHHQPELERLSVREMVETESKRIQDMDPTAEISVSGPDATVEGDTMLGRVFGNLLANAIEHNDSETPEVTVSIATEDGSVAVRIADNGPGIPPATRAELFERPTIGPVEHGFGLYIVDRLCERYDGRIELTDTGSEGSTFTVTLPRADADSSTGTDSPSAAGSSTEADAVERSQSI